MKNGPWVILLLLVLSSPCALAAGPGALQGHRDCAQALHVQERPSEEDGRSCITRTGISIIRQGRAGVPGFYVFSEKTAYFIKRDAMPLNEDHTAITADILMPDGRKIRLEEGAQAKLRCFEHTRTTPVSDENLIGGKTHPLDDSLSAAATLGLENALARRLARLPDAYQHELDESRILSKSDGNLRHPHAALPPRRSTYERALETCLQGIRTSAFDAELSQTQSKLIQLPDLMAGIAPGHVPSTSGAAAASP